VEDLLLSIRGIASTDGSACQMKPYSPQADAEVAVRSGDSPRLAFRSCPHAVDEAGRGRLGSAITPSRRVPAAVDVRRPRLPSSKAASPFTFRRSVGEESLQRRVLRVPSSAHLESQETPQSGQATSPGRPLTVIAVPAPGTSDAPFSAERAERRAPPPAHHGLLRLILPTRR